MNIKQQQIHTSASFTSRIPRFDLKSHSSINHGLRKSASHFNTKEVAESVPKRHSEPDIVRSASVEVMKTRHEPNDTFKLRRDELSLSHIPAVLSDMDDDNASLDSLGILTPNQMKDFLEDELVADSNIVEVIDINGHKIECKLHYEDTQWSSPFLHLSGGAELLEENPHTGDKLGISSKVVDLLKAQNLTEGGYTADNESDICINNQQIIDIIHKASSSLEKKVLSLVPLSESGYHADNESDVLSDASPSPVDQKYILLEQAETNLQRESVTDSGFYSETRSSCVVGSESDFEDSPRLKTRSVQVIDGNLYLENQKMAEQVEIDLLESSKNVIKVLNEVKASEDVASEPDVSVKSMDSKNESSSKKSTISSLNKAKAKSKVVESHGGVPKSPKKPNVMSKIKQMLETKSKEDIPGELKERRGSAPKKGRWDSITAKLAASMADDKKVAKKEVRSRIDTKGQTVKPAKEVSSNGAGTRTSSVSSNKAVNKQNVSSIRANGRVLQAKQNVKENRPSSARSNYSDAPKCLSNANQNKIKSTTSKSSKANERVKSPLGNSIHDNAQHLTKTTNRSKPGVKPLAAATATNNRTASKKRTASSLGNERNSQSSTNQGSNNIKVKKENIEVTFDQPDLIATTEFEGKVKELKCEKEKLVVRNENLEQELQKLNTVYEEERQKFYTQLGDLKQQIHDIHVQYGEEAHKQSEYSNKLQKELEAAADVYSQQNCKAQQIIDGLNDQIKTLSEEHHIEIQQVKDSYEQQMIELKQEQQTQISKMKNSHKLMQEIESLKVVLDLKAEEMHALRKSNMQMAKEIEELSSSQEKVKKLTAKIEDLQEVVSIKSDMERSLTIEHESLKQTVEEETKVNKRLSMEIEELQWKLKFSDGSEVDSLSLPDCKSPSRRSSTLTSADLSPKSPSRRSMTVSICQMSPSKQTQTELFTFSSSPSHSPCNNVSSSTGQPIIQSELCDAMPDDDDLQELSLTNISIHKSICETIDEEIDLSNFPSTSDCLDASQNQPVLDTSDQNVVEEPQDALVNDLIEVKPDGDCQVEQSQAKAEDHSESSDTQDQSLNDEKFWW